MKQYYLIIFLISLFGCKSEYRKICDKFPDGTTKTEYIYPDKDDTLNYIVNRYFQSGKIMFSGTVENGMLVGKKMFYFENGKIEAIEKITSPCKDQTPCQNSTVQFFHPNGKLQQSYVIRNGLMEGIVKGYNRHGILIREVIYIKGVKNGESIALYPNGQVRSKCFYVNDTIIGNIYFFKSNGDTAKYFYFNKGVKSLPFKKWLDNDTVLTGDYSNIEHSLVVWKWYDKSNNEIKHKIEKLSTNGFISFE